MPVTAQSRAQGEAAKTYDQWLSERNAHLQRLEDGAHALGQQIWHALNRGGEFVAAARPSDVAALGAEAMARLGRQASTSLRPLTDEGGAVLAGAQDALTFGLGDRAYAGARALADAANGSDLGDAYSRHYRGTQEFEARQRTQHPIAYGAGEVAGTAAQIGLLGAGEGAVAGLKGATMLQRLSQARRIKQAAGLSVREIGLLGGAGALSGVAGQGLQDLTNRRTSAFGDYAAAAAGGVAGLATTVLTHGRASIGGAADGVVNSTLRDVFHGQAPSLDRARQAAVQGAAIGALVGGVGRGISNDLTNATKGRLGEALSELRTRIRGGTPMESQQVRLKAGGSTRPDHMTEDGAVEAKFGNWARLSRRQLQAYLEPLANYRVDHFLPRDIGAAVGMPLSSISLGLGPVQKASEN